MRLLLAEQIGKLVSKPPYDINATHEISERELIEMLRTTTGWTMTWTDNVYYVSVPNVGKFTCKAPANLPIFYEGRKK